MATRKKTAVQKRDTHRPPFVEVLAAQLGPAYPPGKLLISEPLALQAVIREVPEGKVLTLGSLRTRLARDMDADYTCPMTTGIFLRILAEAADEEARTDVPWWRVVRDNGQLIDKLPGGTARQAGYLQDEGVSLLLRGKTPRVAPLAAYGWQA
ncbi:MAG: MGMT family protein [Bacteroidetes bacterium]|nr:MGMT family protein [Bacteroidota bacterium]